MTTRPIACVDPRSTRSHCGSANADDHRVLMFPSTAADAGRVLFSSDDAVAVPVSKRAPLAVDLVEVTAPHGEHGQWNERREGEGSKA